MAIIYNPMDEKIKQCAESPCAIGPIDGFNKISKPEAGRYHLYLSMACPFAHRPLLVIHYLGLQEVISVSSLAPIRQDNGWEFNNDYPNPVNGLNTLAALYLKANKSYSGKVTVPIFWDKHEQTITSNESAPLAMDLATNWLSLAKNKYQLVPKLIKEDIIDMNTWLHENVNRKVYHVGFAQDQSSYDGASDILFNALEQLDQLLAKSRYLLGQSITLSDLFLLPTLVRFEAVYELHFKANRKPLKEFKHLYQYMLNFMAMQAFRQTVDIAHMKRHYYLSHRHINPMGILPTGPEISW